jgi:hypothetical protein
MKTGSGGKGKTKVKPMVNTVATKRQKTPTQLKSKPAPPLVETCEVEIIPPRVKKSAEPRKKPGTLSHKTVQALNLAVNHGVEPKEAYILANGKAPSRATLTDFKRKVSKFSLQAPGMVKLAHQAVKDVLDGKEARYDAVKVFSNGKKVKYQEVMIPTHTNRLAAAAMIYDRTDPLVRRSENLNVNVDCSPVDLSKYRNR